MCKFYPGFSSCCGVPLRMGLIFIAILSIVTGALLNGAIKKAGVKVSEAPRFASLQLGEESNEDYLYNYYDVVPMQTETVTTSLGVETSTKNETSTRNKTRRTKPCSRGTRRRRKRTRSSTPTTSLGYVTMEIVDEYGKTEMVGFRADRDKGIESHSDSDFDAEADHRAHDHKGHHHKGHDHTGHHHHHHHHKHNETKGMNITQPPVIGQANKLARNGLNLLSVMFLLLGVLLMIATFADSPELVLFCVVMCLALCVMCFVVMAAVGMGCTNQPEFCVLNKLDSPSSIMLVFFWFLYIFAWAFFAAVANGYVKGKDLTWDIITTN